MYSLNFKEVNKNICIMCLRYHAITFLNPQLYSMPFSVSRKTYWLSYVHYIYHNNSVILTLTTEVTFQAFNVCLMMKATKNRAHKKKKKNIDPFPYAVT